VVPATDCVFDLDYSSGVLDGSRPTIQRGAVTGLDWPARSVARLDIELEDANDFSFASGQYVRIRVPGTDQWRSYSMASTAKELPRMRFLIRRIAGGAMSEWLQTRGASDVRVEIEGPMGSFGLAETKGPQIMVAGGTGLAPMLAMLDTLRSRPGPKPPILLCFGCNTADDLFYLDEIELRTFWMPTLSVRTALMERPSAGFDGRIGTAVSLLEDADCARAGATAYLCGPPAMIEAARARLIAGGFAAAAIHAEQFRAT
jgi:benzoate/toluate 1,2-dioxygenase reductase subunit